MSTTGSSPWDGPTPAPPDMSVTARRLVEIANLIPAGCWATDADLAFAYAVRFGKPVTVRELANVLVPGIPIAPNEWTLPWHRLRLEDGRSIARKYGTVGSDRDLDRMFEDEGGCVRDGVATTDRRFELVTVLPSSESADRRAAPRPSH